MNQPFHKNPFFQNAAVAASEFNEANQQAALAAVAPTPKGGVWITLMGPCGSIGLQGNPASEFISPKTKKLTLESGLHVARHRQNKLAAHDPDEPAVLDFIDAIARLFVKTDQQWIVEEVQWAFRH